MTKNLMDKKVEVSAVITQVKNKPAEVTYFTTEGQTIPVNQVAKKTTEAGTRYYTAAKK